jgi:cyclopropane-fatty-acyl-phospholipid synthase
VSPLKLSEVFDLLFGDGVPVAFRAYDGSAVECPEPVGLVEVRTPRAIRYLATAPGQLGLVRAYVAGDIEIHGDLHATLFGLLSHSRGVPWSEVLPQLRRWMLRRPPPPAEEAAQPWRRGLKRHTRARDAKAIAHHYDLSNRFYELLLGPSMAYSCAVFEDPHATLQQAQREKFDLICRKLGLRAGERLLDVGAGWGGLVLHAAQHYGVRATGVTLSRAQARWATNAIRQARLQMRATVRPMDYRDLREGGFDAIASVGAMEHVGSAQLGAYFRAMTAALRPEGRMLNHTITRAVGGRSRTGAFIDRYVFPDGELQSLGEVIGAMHESGLEVRHDENLREHYALTLREWGRNLDRRWAAAIAEVGERRARVWRLYVAVVRIGFEIGRVQIHQTLGIRPGPTGSSGRPPRPEWRRGSITLGSERLTAPPPPDPVPAHASYS